MTTPDPRLDVARQVINANRSRTGDVVAGHILDALDAMRPDECPTCGPTALEAHPRLDVARCGNCKEHAPARLTPAQEIRLRIVETYDDSRCASTDEYVTALATVAAWVEHGDDETPGTSMLEALFAAQGRQLEQAETDRAVAHDAGLEAFMRAQAAEARANLAEARLGQVADAMRDRGPDNWTTHEVLVAVDDALAWTPDDIATAGAATGDGS